MLNNLVNSTSKLWLKGFPGGVRDAPLPGTEKGMVTIDVASSVPVW